MKNNQIAKTALFFALFAFVSGIAAPVVMAAPEPAPKKTALAGIAGMSSAAIKTASKLDPNTIRAVSKLNPATLSRITKMGKSGALSTLAKRPGAMAAVAGAAGATAKKVNAY